MATKITMVQLKKMATEHKIKGRSTMKKAALMDALMAAGVSRTL